MQKTNLRKRNDFSSCTKEELLSAIEELQCENAELLSVQNRLAKENSDLRFRHNYAEKVLESLPDMLTVVSDNGLVVAVVSSEETNHSGIPRECIAGTPIRAFLPDHVLDHVMESIDQAIKTGKSSSMSHLMYVGDEPHYFENRTVRIDQDYNLCVCRDITDSMVAKAELERLSYAVNQISENIYAINPKGEFIFTNKQFLKDRQWKNVDGQSAIDSMFGSTQRWGEIKQAITDNQGILKYITEIQNPAGFKNSYETVVHSVRDINNDEAFWFFARDITDMKMAEQRLIDAKTEAEHSNRLKSAFLANMSHEIRTPLNAIVGFAKLIPLEEDKEAQQDYSTIIDSNADLLLQLINDILDLSKIEAGTLDFTYNDMDFNELCSTMMEVHRMRVPDGIVLISECEREGKFIIRNDRNRLAQVFTNLLTNAIKFTKSGEIRFGYKVKGNQIEAFVKDTGMGISQERLSSIFDRFIKLNNFVPGTGLGLSITRTIIDKIGGTIDVTSEEGKGTEFRFTIPLD